MSKPKRWGLCWTAKVEDQEQGAWVEWSDYAALAAENERLNDIVNDYYHIPNADTVSYASWSKLSAEYEQVKQAGLMLADTSKAVVKQLKDQVFNVCEQRDSLAAENEVLRKKVEWLMKADRLVIWNGTEWQVRHVVEQPIKPRE